MPCDYSHGGPFPVHGVCLGCNSCFNGCGIYVVFAANSVVAIGHVRLKKGFELHEKEVG